MTANESASARLIVIQPAGQAGLILELSRPQLVIGRSDAADLAIEDPYLSGRHALITIDSSGEVTLQDLNSAGGTFVNDERLTGPRVLQAGDLVRFANVVARFEPGGTNETAPTAALPIPQAATLPLPAVKVPADAGDGDAVTYTVSGTVTGTPAAVGLSVRLVDKNAGGDVTLVTGTTGRSGDFTLTAPVLAGDLERRRKSAPDLQVQVLLGEVVTASSAVRYSAPAAVTLNVALPAGTAGLASEHEALTATLGSLYGGPLAGLEENAERQDITYLAAKSGWDARAVAMASLAAQLSEAHADQAIDPAFYYALLRAGLAADPGTLYQTDLSTVERIWAQALSKGIIPRQLKAQLPAALQAFTALAAASVLSAPPTAGVSGLGGILDVNFPGDTASQQRFAGIYARYRGDPTQLWAQVSGEFGADATKRLQLTGQLAYLTVNNGPLISALYQAPGDIPIEAPADLVARGYHEADAWMPLISQVSVPPQIPGGTPEEQAANYAELLAAQVRLSFPTAVMGRLVKDGTVPVLGGPELAGTVAGFLTTAQGDFDIGGEPLARYLARTGTDGGLDKAAIGQVTRIQRVYQMTPDVRSLAGLLRAGVDSAYHVTTRYSPQEFVANFANVVGGQDTATAIYAQAAVIYSTTLSLAVGYLSARRAPALGSAATDLLINPLAGRPDGSTISPPDSPPVFAQATLEELFGNLDYCACDDCRSILSPAAYLVDLLDWINVPTVTRPYTNPQSALLSRRPDIAKLPLTCDNTNIALPYIDLVNEALEYYVATSLSLADYHGHNTDGSLTTGELVAAPQFDETAEATAAYATLKTAWGPAPLPFDRWHEQLRLLASSLGFSLHDLMTRLRVTDDLERSGPIETTAYAWRDILAERLGLSRPEYQVLTESTTVTLAGLYGFAAGTMDPAVVTGLTSLQEFSRRAGVSYAEAADILRATFINPNAALMPLVDALAVGFDALRQLHDGHLSAPEFTAMLPAGLDTAPYGGDVIGWVNANYDQIMGLIVIDVVATAPCDTSKMRLTYADPASLGTPLQPADFLRIARFIRLWRKLGLSIQLTDALLAALCPPPANPAAPTAAEDLDQRFLTFLPRAGFAFEAADLLGLDVATSLPELLACWAPIGTAGPGSLYARMFLTPAMRRADPAFWPVPPDAPHLLDHQAALCAAFNLTGAEFSLITGATATGGLGYDPDTALTLPTISAIYRRGWLARTLRLSVRELLLLIHCTGLDPFASPPDPGPTAPVEPPLTLLARLVAAITGAGLTMTQVLYLLWNVDLSGTSAPSGSVITGLAGTLRQAFAAVDSQFAVKDDPTGAFAKSMLTQVTGPDAADYFFGLLTGTVTTSVHYAGPAPTLPQAVLDAGRQRLSYDDFAKKLSFAGPLAPGDPTATAMTSAANAGAGDPGLVTALGELATACAATTAPFYATYGDIGRRAPGDPGLQSLAQAFVASADPLPRRYAALLAALVDGLAASRKRQQALAAVTAAAACDPGFAPAILGDPAVLHGADGTSAAISDLLAAATTGLDVTYADTDPATPNPPFAPLSYDPDNNPLPAPATGKTTISATWTGYLRAPQDGDYNIQVTADAGATVTVSVNAMDIAMQVSGDTWQNSKAVSLAASALTPVTVTATGLSTTFSVAWEARGATGWQPIPASALYPATVVTHIGATYTRFLKITALASALTLTAPDVAYLASGAGLKADGGLWTDALVTVGQPGPLVSAGLRDVLEAILGYAALKATYSPGTQAPGAGRLLDVLTKLATASPDPGPALLALTGWDQVSLTALLKHFYGATVAGGITVAGAAVSPLTVLRRLDDAFDIVKSSGVTADTLIAATTNAPEIATVEAFQTTVRSRYAEPDWLTVVKPVSDTLRRLRRDALVAYILVQAGPKILTTLGIDPLSRQCTADDLFSYFLFDTQMQPCMETSRIRHALSSVQLFVERALRNLEPAVNPADIDAAQWAWRGRYRVWQANREVFLWPENWLDEGLRDDQSPICATTMKQLLQSDITDDTAAAAYLDYLSGLEQVAKLEPCGICYVAPADGGDYTAHVVARTSGANRKHYYRRYGNGAWTPWENIPLSIEGVPVTPCVWNGRLMLFWLQVQHIPAVTPSTLAATAKSGVGSPASNDPTIGDIGKSFSSSSPSGGSASTANLHMGDLVKGVAIDAGGGGSQTLSNISLVLCYSEYYNGKWQPARTSDHDSPLPWDGPLDYTQFDRGELALWPWMAEHGTDEALYLQVQDRGALRRDDGIGHDPDEGKGFVLYNTHSAPVPWSTLADVPFATPARLRQLAVASSSLEAGYFTGSTPDPLTFPTGSFSVLRSNSPLPMSVIEAQPDVPDQWDIPFILSDVRNSFYVTTNVEGARFSDFSGVLMDGAHATGQASSPDLVAIASPPPAVPPTGELTTSSGAQRALQQSPDLHWVLEDPATITFNGATIGFAGQERPS